MDFVPKVFFETQRWIIEALFGWRGDGIETATFLDSYDPSNTSITVVDGESAGWWTVQRGESIHGESLYLTSACRGEASEPRVFEISGAKPTHCGSRCV